MANVFAVHSVGSSITTFLRNTYPQQVGQPADHAGRPEKHRRVAAVGRRAGVGQVAGNIRITIVAGRIAQDLHGHNVRSPQDH